MAGKWAMVGIAKSFWIKSAKRTVVSLILNSNIDSDDARQRHIDEINQKKDAVRAGICPRCGGELVRRNGKYGEFIGCSNFPRCRYTQKI